MSHTENSSLNFHLSEEVQAIKDVAASFADNEIAPHVLHFDETQEFPHEIFKKLGELGFLGILVPTEYGGSGLGYQE
jgi:alkylation response protein AidB-like acyl-CoA dehydrogenase